MRECGRTASATVRAVNRLLTAAALVLPCASTFAQGGPPLRTDDPGTPGDGHWELNFAAVFDEIAGVRTLEAPLCDLNYGWGERVQLKYEVPWVFVDGEDAEDLDGLGNSLFGIKWRFLDADGSTPAISTYPQIEVENSGSSSSERGITEEGTTFFLPLEVAWDLGEGGLNFEVGRSFSEQRDDSWVGGLAAGRSVSERVELLAEVHGESSSDFESSSGVIDVGTRIHLAPGRVLLASVGNGLWSSESERTGFLAYLGIQLQF